MGKPWENHGKPWETMEKPWKLRCFFEGKNAPDGFWLEFLRMF